MKNILCGTAVILFGSHLWAQSPTATPALTPATPAAVATEAVPEEAPPTSLPVDDQSNYFGVGLGIAGSDHPGPEGALSYGRRLGSQFRIGATVSGFESDYTSGGSGNSANDQYYKTKSHQGTMSFELNGTYLFRENGYKRWGFLLRAGLGREWGSMKGHYERYGDDNGFFHFGDGYVLKESGPEQTLNYQRTFVHIEPAYQFVWTPRHGTSVGAHILELSVGLSASDETPSTTFTRPDGNVETLEARNIWGDFKVSYVVMF